MTERKPMRLVSHPGSGRTAVVPRVLHPLPAAPTLPYRRSLALVPESRSSGALRATLGGRTGAGADAAGGAPRGAAAPAGPGAHRLEARVGIAMAGLATFLSLLALLR
jgi:hypothetical protein